MKTVAIIGAGPGGLVTARYLKAQGLEPVLFEQSDSLGGQWNGTAEHSGVWPDMRTNTSKLMTSFSDLEPNPDLALYPSNQEMLAYLKRYADKFDITSAIRTRTRVEEISLNSDNQAYDICFTTTGEQSQTETFPNVVIAPGRYNKPWIPPVKGLQSFSGSEGVNHTFNYKNPEQYRGKRVLLGGCSISALEIASDLAMLGAEHVVNCNRRQRYVLPKIIAGVPNEQLTFSRFAALAEEYLPAEIVAMQFKEFILRTSGSPEQYGAAKPADNVFEAGITQSHYFLPLVAEGRIFVRPWIEEVRDRTVQFTDGSSEEFDAIMFGTGFKLALPYLSDDLRQTLNRDADSLDLYDFTFHPELPGLAFIGMYELVGPYFTVLELQARWLAYAWSGVLPMPSTDVMQAGIARHRRLKLGLQKFPMHALAILFSRNAGVEPPVAHYPELAAALMFGPLSARSFRLYGPDAVVDAAEHLRRTALATGAMREQGLTPEQRGQLQALAGGIGDPAWTGLVDKLTA
jgi:dimethylaniline monooxygenase (N-oxide forming)